MEIGGVSTQTAQTIGSVAVKNSEAGCEPCAGQTKAASTPKNKVFYFDRYSPSTGESLPFTYTPYTGPQFQGLLRSEAEPNVSGDQSRGAFGNGSVTFSLANPQQVTDVRINQFKAPEHYGTNTLWKKDAAEYNQRLEKAFAEVLTEKGLMPESGDLNVFQLKIGQVDKIHDEVLKRIAADPEGAALIKKLGMAKM